MNKFKIKGIDQEIYHEQLDNGLNIYVLPILNKKNHFVCYFTKFGSMLLDFYSEQEQKDVTIPQGIAHFLEHKMFEQEDGVDPFEFYAQTGTSCNASTSYKSTRYYFSGTDFVERNLNYLLDYVNSPYFTDESVEKEKEIICEEINMNLDNPEWFAEEELLRMLFKYHPFRIPIAGTCESVRNTNKEDLYRTYNAFYNPNNMSVVVAGNVDYKEIIDIIKNNESVKKQKKQIIPSMKEYNEPTEVNEKYKVLNLDNVLTTKLGYSLKMNLDTLEEKDLYKINLYIGAILNILFGSSSLFKDSMLESGKLTTLYLERMIIDKFMVIELWAETDYPDELIKEINKVFSDYVITEEELERCKKVWISSEVMATDNTESMVSSVINDLVEYNEIKTDRISIIRSLNLEELNKIKEKIDTNNSSILVLDSK